MKKANDESNAQDIPDRVDDNRRTQDLTEYKLAYKKPTNSIS